MATLIELVEKYNREAKDTSFQFTMVQKAAIEVIIEEWLRQKQQDFKTRELYEPEEVNSVFTELIEEVQSNSDNQTNSDNKSRGEE